jgi:hypothetical protein
VKRTQKLLIEAKKLLQTEGWIQGHSHLEGRGYCASGAVSHVAERNPNVRNSRSEAHVALADAIKPEYEPNKETAVDVIVGFNDAYKRTRREVLLKFNKAIKLAAKGT